MFKGLGNIANLGSMLKQAQEMGSKLQGLGEELKKVKAQGSAGGGMVQAEVNGAGEVLSVQLEPELVERQDRELIEDLIPAAINDALAKAKQMHAEKMRELTGGLDLPGALQNLGGGGGDTEKTS